MQLLEIPIAQDFLIMIGIAILIWCLILSWIISDATNQKKHLANEKEIIQLLKDIDKKITTKQNW